MFISMNVPGKSLPWQDWIRLFTNQVDIEGNGRITKRGNGHLRRTIWMMTTTVIYYNDVFKTYYLKLWVQGLPYKMTVLATAHQLIRVIYAMLTGRTNFCPQMNS